MKFPTQLVRTRDANPGPRKRRFFKRLFHRFMRREAREAIAQATSPEDIFTKYPIRYFDTTSQAPE